jgi:hypothetical protein
MSAAVGQLNNREIALLVWLAILLAVIVAYKPTRQSLGPLIRLILFSKITVVLLLMLGYVALIAYLFYLLHLSHWWMLKDALFWLFGSAIILLFNVNKAVEEDHYIRKIALGNLKFAVVLAFIINLYVFNLAVELILLPFLATLAMLSVVAATKDEYKPARRLINGTVGVIGFGFLLYAVIRILTDPRGFATIKNLQDFLMPVILTLAFLPFLYGVAVYCAYEQLLTHVGLWICDDKDLSAYAKRQIIWSCRLRLARVRHFAHGFVYKVGGAKSRAEVSVVIHDFKAAAASGKDDSGSKVPAPMTAHSDGRSSGSRGG